LNVLWIEYAVFQIRSNRHRFSPIAPIVTHVGKGNAQKILGRLREVVAVHNLEDRARLERGEGLPYIETMKSDANDGKHWSEMDVRNLMASLRCGDTIEEAAEHLCRSGTVDEVRRKADELGLKYKSSS
jgi:hypothetical protein